MHPMRQLRSKDHNAIVLAYCVRLHRRSYAYIKSGMLPAKPKQCSNIYNKKKACRRARFTVHNLAGYIAVACCRKLLDCCYKDMPEITSWSAMQQPDYNGTAMEEATGPEYKTVSTRWFLLHAYNFSRPGSCTYS